MKTETKKKRWTHEEKLTIQRLYDKGLRPFEIAEKMGIEYNLVRWQMLRQGLKTERWTWNDEKDEVLCKAANYKIAALKLGISEKAVKSRLCKIRNEKSPKETKKNKSEVSRDGIHPRILDAMEAIDKHTVEYTDGSYRNSRIVWYPNHRIEIDGKTKSLGELMQMSGLIKR